jgi:hypothetical protein
MFNVDALDERDVISIDAGCAEGLADRKVSSELGLAV